jgi:hypothetical protein
MLAEQQREQRLGQRLAGRAALGADVLGEPGDVPCVTPAVQDHGEVGEPAGLGDHETVQADKLVGVDTADDAGGEGLQGVGVVGGVQAHGGGQVPHHRGEQLRLVAEVGVHGALGHPSGRRQLVKRAPAIAGKEEHAEGSGQDLGFARAALVRCRPATLAEGRDLGLLAHKGTLLMAASLCRLTIGGDYNDTE